MLSPDAINAAFEALGGLFVLSHCRAVLRDRTVKGVSTAAVAFFTAWGWWNLYYYPSLGQVWSFIGGVGLVLANTVYICLLLYFSHVK